MSNTVEWQKRQENHRYSQDDRALAYKFTKEIDPLIDKFLGDRKKKLLVVGTYDTTKEPWRLLAVAGYRKYGLKLLEIVHDPLKPHDVTLSLRKHRR